MNNNFVSSSKASNLLNVHPNTLRAWESKGLIKSYRSTPSGQRKYDVENFLKNKNVIEVKKDNICYCRDGAPSPSKANARQAQRPVSTKSNVSK
jgi:predicted site-specific integrase-resolvase